MQRTRVLWLTTGVPSPLKDHHVPAEANRASQRETRPTRTTCPEHQGLNMEGGRDSQINRWITQEVEASTDDGLTPGQGDLCRVHSVFGGGSLPSFVLSAAPNPQLLAAANQSTVSG